MRRELLGALPKMLGYALVLEVLLAAAILFWPSFRDHLDALRAMAPMAVLRDLVDQLGRTGTAGYVYAQHHFKGCNTLGAAAAVLFAMGAIAGEAQRGTLELWLARPFSRARMLAWRWSAGALAVVLPVFLTSLTVPTLLARVGETMDLAPLMLASAHEALFLLAIYALTFLYSALSSRPGRIAFVMLFLSTFQFALYMVQDVTHWSVFRMVDLEVFLRIHAERRLDPRLVLPLALVVAGAYAATQRALARRTP